MTRRTRRMAFVSTMAIILLAGGYQILPESSTPVLAAANEVTFPELEQLEQYTTVERGVTKEHMLTSRAALDAVRAGQQVPPGTHIVLVDYQSGVLHRYLVAQKTGDSADSWQYQWFWPDRTIKADENTARCYSCHQTRQNSQFMFTFEDALGASSNGS